MLALSLSFGQLFEPLQIKSEGGTQNTNYNRALEVYGIYKPTKQPTNQPTNQRTNQTS